MAWTPIVKTVLSVFERSLPQLYLQAITGEHIIARQPGGLLGRSVSTWIESGHQLQRVAVKTHWRVTRERQAPVDPTAATFAEGEVIAVYGVVDAGAKQG